MGGQSSVQTGACFSCPGKTLLSQPVSCWSLCPVYAGLLQSNMLPCLYFWSWLFLPQYSTQNLSSGFIQTFSRMCYRSPRSDALGSHAAWFPKPQRFGNSFLKSVYQKCWWGAERRQWQKCITMQTFAFAFMQLKCPKFSPKYYSGLTVCPRPWWFFIHTSAQGVGTAFHLTLSTLKRSVYYKVTQETILVLKQGNMRSTLTCKGSHCKHRTPP